MSSVRLVDEAAAERQRVDLINRLVKEALAADFDGVCTCESANAIAWMGQRQGGGAQPNPCIAHVGGLRADMCMPPGPVALLPCPGAPRPPGVLHPVSPAGAIEGLKSLKQARLTDPATGRSFGLVRLYADPGEPQPAAAPKAAHHKPAKMHSHAHRAGGGVAGGKPVQVRMPAAAAGMWPAAIYGQFLISLCGVPSLLFPCLPADPAGQRFQPLTFALLGPKLPVSACGTPCRSLVACPPSLAADLLQLRHHHHPAMA